MLCWWCRRTQQLYRSADGRYKGGKYEEFELRKRADKKEQKKYVVVHKSAKLYAKEESEAAFNCARALVSL